MCIHQKKLFFFAFSVKCLECGKTSFQMSINIVFFFLTRRDKYTVFHFVEMIHPYT